MVTPFATNANSMNGMGKISGAFGIKFNDTLSDNEMNDCADRTWCPVSPSSPYIVFSSYLVRLTELEGRIFEIIGKGEVSSNQECIAHAEKILRALKRKYNLKLNKIEFDNSGMSITTWSVETGSSSLWYDHRKSIHLQCRDYTKINIQRSIREKELLHLDNHTISITYRDNSVKENEKIQGMLNEEGL